MLPQIALKPEHSRRLGKAGRRFVAAAAVVGEQLRRRLVGVEIVLGSCPPRHQRKRETGQNENAMHEASHGRTNPL
jgi:hypothetical protein